MAEIGCPAFLTGEAQVQGWFESADRADFDEYVAMCMYNAMLRAKHGRTTSSEVVPEKRAVSERTAMFLYVCFLAAFTPVVRSAIDGASDESMATGVEYDLILDGGGVDGPSKESMAARR